MTEDEALAKHGADLQKAGQALLDAAYAYWEIAQKARTGGALFWLDDDAGRTVIFTRGEYRNTLMSNIDRLRPDGCVVDMQSLPTWCGKDRSDEFPEGRVSL